ncbi:MAG TPA: hypothetical protein VLT33_05060, partial [Labilithrix sp.]|nr:hypothetical protein [Labilithrix sp.]
MASDDESTQPIDIAALRSSLTSAGAGPRPEREEEGVLPPDEPFRTDEHTAVGMREEILDSDGPFPAVHPASSITRVNVAPPGTPRVLALPPEEEAAVTVSPPTTARLDVVPSLPGTVPAHELVQALVAAMGARPERVDRLAQTDESDPGAVTLMTVDAPESPESEEAATGTRLPFPAAWSDVEVTSVSPGRGPAKAVAATDEVAAAVAASALPDDEAGTLAGSTLPRSESVLSTDRAPPREPDAEQEILEVDSMELESEPEIADLEKTGEGVAFFHEPERAAEHEEHEEPDPDELPRFSLASMDDIVLSASADDVQIVSRPVSSVSIGGGFDDEPAEDVSAEADVVDEDELSYDDEGGATLHRANDPAPAVTARAPQRAPEKEKLPPMARPSAP